MKITRVYGIYLNGRHGGTVLTGGGPDGRGRLTFATYADAERELDSRGYVQSTAVDRDSFGQPLKPGQRTAYVISFEVIR